MKKKYLMRQKYILSASVGITKSHLGQFFEGRKSSGRKIRMFFQKYFQTIVCMYLCMMLNALQKLLKIIDYVNLKITITYKSRLTQKKLHKKTDAIFSIYGRNGINPWHFFLNSQLGLSRSLRPKEAA